MPELLTRRPQFAAVLGVAAGLSAMAGGFARYLCATSCEDLVRIVLYAAVFAGALISAGSAVLWLALSGRFAARMAVRPGGGVVNLAALLLCVWMGYGFVTEHAPTFGVAVLLAESLLAAALGAHLMVSSSVGFSRYGLAGGFFERSPVRCGVVRRRVALAVTEGFEWPDERMPALFDDDFAQKWTLLDEIRAAPGSRRFGVRRAERGARDVAAWGARGRCRRRCCHQERHRATRAISRE
jgi:NAD(P) transhydrogenase subunit beta